MEAQLFDSERRYFSAGSRDIYILGGTFSVLPGFEHLPSGCVMHSIEADPAPATVADWTRRIEQLFRDHGSRLCRFYLPGSKDHLHDMLVKLGFRPTKEVGLAIDLQQSTREFARDPNLVPIENAAAWACKVRLYIDARVGPDGHDMQQGAYAALELAKCDAGYMACYLYSHDQRPIAAVSLAIHRGFARMKNLVVHPRARGKGLGHRVVLALAAEAACCNATHLGAFAVAGSSAHNVYRDCGLSDVTYQTEWTKPL